MKLWIDDVRPAPTGYFWAKSVNIAKEYILCNDIEILDMDHDAGDYAKFGGDYIRLLDWLEEHNLSYPIRIHSMNVVGRMNMEAICRRNGWTIVE